jgi:acyl-CoA reductase-like NAD-dependent aldehyde dehydrogenase
MELHNFIDGEWMPPSSGAYIHSWNPATAQVNALVPDSASDDVDAAVKAAQAAFGPWSRLPAPTRASYMHRIANLVESRLDEFAQAESQDQGKPIWLAKAVDIPRVVHNFRYFATLIENGIGEEAREMQDGRALSYTTRQPSGVAGMIAPWNLPLYLLSFKIAPCMAAGSTCVCKPSEFTSVTAYMLCQVFQEVNLPKGVVNVVFGTGPKAGAALVEHPNVPTLSFTGGTATGRLVMRNSAEHIKRLSLELGGKNPNIIFDDADLTSCVATSLRSSFVNQGEICLCGSRILVQRSIYDTFLDKFVEATKGWTVGPPDHPDTKMGPLVSEQHMDKVLSYIQMAKEYGATIHCGGERLSALGAGFYVAPTIITGIPFDHAVFQEEIFGPVVTINTFDTEEEAIQLANCVKYGLSATVWTENGKRQRRVANALDAGTVWVNCWLVRDLHMPFGGVKASGVGREGGVHSLDFYSNVKTICLAN